jgi:hypothetical protein
MVMGHSHSAPATTSHLHTAKQLEDSALDAAYRGSIRAIKLAHPVPSHIINSENFITHIAYDRVSRLLKACHTSRIFPLR